MARQQARSIASPPPTPPPPPPRVFLEVQLEIVNNDVRLRPIVRQPTVTYAEQAMNEWYQTAKPGDVLLVSGDQVVVCLEALGKVQQLEQMFVRVTNRLVPGAIASR